MTATGDILTTITVSILKNYDRVKWLQVGVIKLDMNVKNITKFGISSIRLE